MSALKGVNLGGWLVVEKWITPSLFKGLKATNHYQLEQTPAGRARLEKHYQEFITETDLKWLNAQGIELLRVPFGHWIFGDVPPYQSAIQQLDWLVATAGKYGMRLLLDMHAATGAQNTKDHSGSGNHVVESTWLNRPDWQAQTIDVLTKVAKRYKNEPAVWGIELLNEPSIDVTGLKLARFYRRAYSQLTKVARPGTYIIFSDAFHPLLTVNTFGWLAKRNFPVAIDVHLYHCFGATNKQKTVHKHLQRARRSRWYIRFLSLFQPVVVGEWSAMLPYRVTDENTHAFIDAQQKSYGQALAWCYWTYKTENAGRWNFHDTARKHSVLPK